MINDVMCPKCRRWFQSELATEITLKSLNGHNCVSYRERVLGHLHRRAQVPCELWHPTDTQHLKLLGLYEDPVLSFVLDANSHKILKLLENTENSIFHSADILETQRSHSCQQSHELQRN